MSRASPLCCPRNLTTFPSFIRLPSPLMSSCSSGRNTFQVHLCLLWNRYSFPGTMNHLASPQCCVTFLHSIPRWFIIGSVHLWNARHCLGILLSSLCVFQLQKGVPEARLVLYVRVTVRAISSSHMNSSWGRYD